MSATKAMLVRDLESRDHTISERLKIILCDPYGKVSIAGSEEELKILDGLIKEVAELEHRIKQLEK